MDPEQRPTVSDQPEGQDAKQAAEEREKDVLAEARRRFKEAEEAEASVRLESLRDLRFRTGDQWDPQAREIRERDNRPCFTFNRIPQYVHQVTNGEREQRPSLQVTPVGEGAERLAADIWQGLIRHIELRSDAECAYDTAFESAAGDSFGYFTVDAEYAGFDSFDQELRIDRVLDPFSVFIDPAANLPDRSDMTWGFVCTQIARDDFKRLHPHARMSSMGFFDTTPGYPGRDWATADFVRVARYWRRTYRKRILQKLSVALAIKNDRDVRDTLFSDEMPTPPQGAEVIAERVVDYPSVEWFKLTGTDVLVEGKWPGLWIPIIPVLGDEFVVDGKKMLISITRFLRDPQQLLNYVRSQQAETIALVPKAPWVGPVGSFKTHTDRWQNSNNTNYAYLEYDPVETPSGQFAQPPQRNVAEPPIQALNQSAQMADNDLNQNSGIYKPSLGNDSQEVSGVAINARKMQSEISNFHFVDNFRRSMRHLGRILLDLIPHYYDRANRIVRIVKPDGTEEMVLINGNTEYKGKPVFFDPEVGRYDIHVEVGPSYKDRQDQIFTMLTELIRSNPNLWGVIGDLILRAAPLPGSLGPEAADRMKAMLLPAVQAQIQGESGGGHVPQAVQQRLQQDQQMIQALTQQIDKLLEMIRTKRIEADSRREIAALQGQVQIVLQDMKNRTAESNQLMKHEFDMLTAKMQAVEADLAAINQPQQQPEPEQQT
jgi:hypothetical protein